eukprot:Nk52_evm27s216 gene=Nk52_evmTU27s216
MCLCISVCTADPPLHQARDLWRPLESPKRAGAETDNDRADPLGRVDGYKQTKEEIPSVEVSGTYYEVGLGIGKEFRKLITDTIAADDMLQDLETFTASERGQTVLKQLEKAARDNYPHYMEELEGTADGCGLPLARLLQYNFKFELHVAHMKDLLTVQETARDQAKGHPLGWRSKKRPGRQLSSTGMAVHKQEQLLGDHESCSDVHMRTGQGQLYLAHNEDNSASMSKGYFVTAHLYTDPKDPTTHLYSFKAFTYPGMLCGWAYGFNSFGMVITVNAVFPVEFPEAGVSIGFTARDVLAAQSIHEATKRAKVPHQSLGNSYNIMSLAEKRLVNVEAACNERWDVKNLGREETYFHANAYLRMSIKVPDDGGSSAHRLARYKEMKGSLKTGRDLLSVIGDNKDTALPIYKPPSKNKSMTLASVFVSSEEQTMSLWWFKNPKLHPDKPDRVFDIGKFVEDARRHVP